MKCSCVVLMAIAGGLLIPSIASAQSVADHINGLQAVLDKLYNDMLPKCSSLIGVGRAIACLASVFYIGHRVWRSMAAAEPIDVYPLLRPFAITLVILNFPAVLAVFNGFLSPTVNGTKEMVVNSDAAVKELFAKKEAAVKNTEQWQALVGETQEGDYSLWVKYAHPSDGGGGMFSRIWKEMQFIWDKMKYNMQNELKMVLSTILQILYAAASLCINTLRVFNLILLGILGPLVLGLSVFDGLHHTLPVYLARYINIYLWLPICNILGSVLGTIQQHLIQMDLDALATNGVTSFGLYDAGYLVFMVIGIICYTTVPSIADWIVHAGGGSALQQKVTSHAHNTAGKVVDVATNPFGIRS
ncbi:conjugative transposon protein TraJ [Filimonas effusa]|uniref:Conjugative transposon protein TraJ n=1 Tax=Filimonas effusa TaxID=2508721 RepID=A0A4Q1D3F9_9BACT|nr:conjugative transposon protein TraJ [Filimonas effusa]RXK81667.1 conjugative transposon protein TraJ [Filimonas effusa]